MAESAASFGLNDEALNGRKRPQWFTIIGLICTLLIVGVAGCAQNDSGGDNKVFKGISAAVRELDPNDEKQFQALVQLIRDRSYKDVRKLVEILHGEDESAADNAAALLIELDDLPSRPLLDALDQEDPRMLVWEMRQVLIMALESRSAIVGKLTEMLDDKTALSQSPFANKSEEAPVERRVCDEAYMMMRRLLALEDEETREANNEVFLDMSDEDRDAEIKRLSKSDKWIELEQADFD